MQRREFIAGLSCTAVPALWPRAAPAQSLPVIGFLGAGSADEWRLILVAFRQGLKDMGYVEDQNVVIEYRWAENQYDRLPALAADLARRHVGVIAAIGSAPAAMAAKAAAPAIPMVFGTGADPVQVGLVKSFNRPGENATGFLFATRLLVQKQFEILHTLLPDAQEIAVLVNPTNRPEEQIRDVQRAATILGQKIMVLKASTDAEIDAAFLTLVQQRVGALHVPGDAFLWGRRDKLVALAERNAIPAIYAQREFVDIGGLMSYGASVTEVSRLVGGYAGRLLKGEKPADLPVQQSTKFELVINLKTARALGLSIPETLLATADEVIQ